MNNIQISTELRDYIEQLHYESSSSKNILHFLIENKIFKDDEYFNKVFDYALKKEKEYLLAKDTMAKKYNLLNKQWTLDFDKGIVTYE